MSVYYNEIDPYCAEWLRNLMREKLIPEGDVDERSITDVDAADLLGFDTCHFFAGIGGWPLALRLAGWPDAHPVWTGSCPCQPFSAAGQRKGFADERHLWPVWSKLVTQCHPPIVFGEQVGAAIKGGWLDAVFADLEGEDYACGATVLPACGVGAPHIRQRLWFVAHSDGRNASAEGLQRSWQHGQRAQDGGAGELANSDGARRGPGRPGEAGGGRDAPRIEPSGLRHAGVMGNAVGTGLQEQRGQRDVSLATQGAKSRQAAIGASTSTCSLVDAASEQVGIPGRARQSRATDFWRDAEWIACTDGKARPVGPGSFPLGHGIQNRASKLRAYGNAIVPQIAAEFIAAADEAMIGAGMFE